MTAHPLAGRQRDPVFLSQSAPTVLIDADLVIRAATPSYQTMTGRGAEELVDVAVFDAFPENPDSDEVGTAETLRVSLEASLRRRTGQQVVPLRYDIPDSRRPGSFLVRSWLMTTTPVHDGRSALGVSVRVQDTSPLGTRLSGVLDAYADLLAAADPASARVGAELTEVMALLDEHDSLSREVTHLRRAMSSRPVIEQAKGMLMAERRCDADTAFGLLRSLSQDHNVPLADVAAAIVYQATQRD